MDFEKIYDTAVYFDGESVAADEYRRMLNWYIDLDADEIKAVYEDEGVVAETKSIKIKNRYLSQNIGFRISDLTMDDKTNRLKIVVVDPGLHDNLELFRKEALNELGNVLDLYFSAPDYLEVVVKGVNKGKALIEICDFLDFSVEDTVAVGDEENDIPMIIEAEVGCAVANATDEVKKVADFITANDCDHDGIIEVIEKFVLS